MKVIDPGHVYELNWLDGEPDTSTHPYQSNQLIFVKREGEKHPGNTGAHPGTTMQEVLRALIDRLNYVDTQQPHDYNEQVVFHLREAMMFIERRAAELHGRQFTTIVHLRPYIENAPTCPLCGHIGCSGGCRA